MGLPPPGAKAQAAARASTVSGFLTREDVREELRHFLWETLEKEIRELGERVQKDIREEFRHLLLDTQITSKDFADPEVEHPDKRACNKLELANCPVNVPAGYSLEHPGAPDAGPHLAWVEDDTELIELPPHSSSHQGGELPGLLDHDSTNSPNLEQGGLQQVVAAWESKSSAPTGRDEVVDIARNASGVSVDSQQSAPFQTQGAPPTHESSALWRSVDSGDHRRSAMGSIMMMKRRASHAAPMAELQGLLKRSKTLGNEGACTTALSRAVKHEWFDYFMGVFLILNALSIGWQVDHMAGKDEKTPPQHFRIIDTIFCVIFAIELAARLMVYKRRLYSMKGWQWNVFDTLLVVFQVIDELTMLLLTGTEMQEVVEEVGALRILRLGRVIRLIRMVRLIPELKSMVYLISASMWSFFWTLMLLLLLMYCFAVYYTEYASDLAKESEGATAENIRMYWGSVGKSVFSLYQAITGGDDWNNFVQVFEGDSSYFLTGLVFCAYIAFAILVMLNLVTGVFVEGAQRIIKEDKDNEMIRQVCKLFQAADIDGNHTISHEEFTAQIDSNRMDEYFQAVELSRQEASNIFKLLDVDRSESLSVEEFVRGTLRLKGPARSVDLAALTYEFNSSMLVMNKVEGKLSQVIQILRAVLSENRLTHRLTQGCAPAP